MYSDLYERFATLEGQPVKIFTDDGRAATGIVIVAGEECVRLIIRNGDIFLVEYAHIASVEEPQMRLRVRCASRCTGGKNSEEEHEERTREHRDT